ncbi:MAG: hypothetical protein J6U48_02985, partial [Alistipes sp.]|nr:hypothetical protein [Alistipes sp.]
EITGDSMWEESYPSSTSLCIYMGADGNLIKDIVGFVGTQVPADASIEDMLDSGQSYADFIPSLVADGYALAVYQGLKPGTTYDIALGFTTIFDELKTFRLQYTTAAE